MDVTLGAARASVAAALVCALLTAFAAVAQAPSARPPGGVADPQAVLSAAERRAIERQIADLGARHDASAAVLVLRRRSEPTGGVERFAQTLHRRWALGPSGVLFVVIAQERVARIQLGPALGAGWSAWAETVMDDALMPAFRQGRFARGLRRGLAALARRLEEGRSSPLAFVFMAAASAAAVAFIFYAAGRPPKCPKCGSRRGAETVIDGSTHSGAAHRSRMIQRTCADCGHRWAFVKREPSDGGGFGGSGGGFGGGGGGATGRW